MELYRRHHLEDLMVYRWILKILAFSERMLKLRTDEEEKSVGQLVGLCLSENWTLKL